MKKLLNSALSALLILCIWSVVAASGKTVPPKLIRRAIVAYPKHSKLIGEEGTTWVKVLVAPDGTAQKALILKSSGSPDLDDYAQQVAEKSTYQAGTKNGKAVQDWLVLSIVSLLPEIVKGDQAQIDALKDTISHTPKKTGLYENLGTLYLQEMRWAEASKAYLQATQLDPGNEHNWVYLGDTELHMEEFPAAQGYYQKALALSPSDFQATAGLAKAYASIGNKEKAIVFYEQAAELKPEDASIQSAAGDLLANANQFDKAIPYLEKAHSLDPQNFTTLQDLGFIYYQKQDYEKAAAAYQDAIKLQPDTLALYNNLGSAWLNAGKPTEAVPALEKAVKMDPTNPASHYSLGIAYFEQKLFDKAIPILQHAIDLMLAQKTPSNLLSDAYFELGLAQFQTGDKTGSLQSLQKAANLKPDNTMILTAIAQMYENISDIPNAISTYQKIIQLDSTAAEPHERLGYLYFQQKNYTLAQQEMQAALELYKKQNQPEKVKQMQDNLDKIGATIKNLGGQGNNGLNQWKPEGGYH